MHATNISRNATGWSDH